MASRNGVRCDKKIFLMRYGPDWHTCNCPPVIYPRSISGCEQSGIHLHGAVQFAHAEYSRSGIHEFPPRIYWYESCCVDESEPENAIRNLHVLQLIIMLVAGAPKHVVLPPGRPIIFYFPALLCSSTAARQRLFRTDGDPISPMRRVFVSGNRAGCKSHLQIGRHD